MKKTKLIVIGMLSLCIAVILLCINNIWCAITSALLLVIAVVTLNFADRLEFTQDERRGRKNKNKI